MARLTCFGIDVKCVFPEITANLGHTATIYVYVNNFNYFIYSNEHHRNLRLHKMSYFALDFGIEMPYPLAPASGLGSSLVL